MRCANLGAVQCCVFLKKRSVCDVVLILCACTVLTPQRVKLLEDMRRREVTSTERVLAIYKLMSDTWDRLSMFAFFWNAASNTERRCILEKFFLVMANGSTPANIDDYPAEMVTE